MDRTHTYKILDYYHEFKENNPTEFIELMVIANRITHERKKRLSSWGVSYKEIPESEFININNPVYENNIDNNNQNTNKEDKSYPLVAGYNGSISGLRKSYTENNDKELGCLLLKILDWAYNERIFMPSPVKNRHFRLRSKSQQGLVTFFYDGLIQIYLTNIDNYDDKKSMYDEVMQLNPILNYDDLDNIRGSRNLSKKIQELSEAELDKLLKVFRKYCD